MTLSVDLRKRVILAVDDGEDITKVAQTFKVSRRTIYYWLNLRSKANSLVPKTGYQRGHSHKIKNWDQFKKFAETNKHSTLKIMKSEWEKSTGETISKSVLQRALNKIGYTSKKNFWVYRSE